MLHLDGVTLCCVDTTNHALALRAIEHSRRSVRFARAVLLTDALPSGLRAPEGVEIVPVDGISSRAAYSKFVVKSLLPHIATPHVLLVQWDGYVTNPDAWDSAFLECDYIGAQWPWHDDGMRVGNGGFSLRSRRLLQALQDPRIVCATAEDETICRTHRPLLEREYGIRFASEPVADRFAFEAAHPAGRPFGFHGLYNFCRVVPPGELAALAPGLSDAIARSPQLAQLLRNCHALGQWTAAVAIAQRMLVAQPAHDEARAILAQAQANASQVPAVGRNDPCPCGSGRRYKHCHGAVPASQAASVTPDAAFARALEAHQRGELDTAERGYRSVLAALPEHAAALHYLGVIQYQRNRIGEALPLLQRAVTRVPQEPEFHNNLGLALAAADRTDEAIAAHRRAIALEAGHAGAWNNLGLALQAANDLPAAIAAFRAALAIAPDFAQAHWNLGLALLAHAEFPEGWREYEWRLAITELGKRNRVYPGPRWDGSNPAGKTILLTREQGLGDTLHFARFARTLADRGALVAMEVPAPLVGLVARVPGVASACGPGDPLPRYDAHLPLLSVPGALGIATDSIPHSVPYVTPDPSAVTAIAALLAPWRTSFRIGIAWAGSRDHVNDRRRSCPLAAMAPLFGMAGTAWFSLQKDDGEDQIAAVPEAGELILLDARNDFDRKAALVDALDLVISVDTSNAHLAGALARPLWLLLPFAPDWRWQLGRADSPWYPTARLFRQPRPGDWNAVVADVGRMLRARLAVPR